MKLDRRILLMLGGGLGVEAMVKKGSDPKKAQGQGNRNWKCVYALDSQRKALSGSAQAFAKAIRQGADLRIYTEFRHNEHIDTTSKNPELIQEVADFRITYLLDNRWGAGIISLRQPISLPDGFGPRPSMS